jgi:hypothetical protein
MANGPWGNPGDVHPLRVTVKVRLGTSLAQYGFHLRSVTGDTPDLPGIADGVVTTVLPTLKLILANIDEVTSIVVTDVVSGEGVERPQTGQTGQAGQAGATLPTFVAATVVLKSSIRRRWGQGRFFLPIRGLIHQTGEILSGGGATAVGNHVAAIMGAYGPASVANSPRLINFHDHLLPTRPHKKPEPLPDVPASRYDLTSARVNPTLTALHSRRQGIGS